MLKKDRAQIILKKLNKLYPETTAPLKSKSNFQFLIAVLLSAQCTDERVNRITPKLFSLANTPSKMMKLKVKQIYDIIRPCGLAPQKSKSIHELSKIIMDKYNGKIPRNIEELEKLPGVGHKTASVVISKCFNVPAFPVDTHIHRLAQRWGLSKGKNVTQTERDLKKIFPISNWNKLHLQIIFYGREYCTARGCDGTNCDICKVCYPNRKKGIKTNKA
tara:strand:- start:87 stop:740 length:654 start_codon:yes stop_codon:yes gene_type:complete